MHPLSLGASRTLVFAAAFQLVVAAIVDAQTLTIEGTVRDTTGAPIEHAQVEARRMGLVRPATSDASGLYRIDGLAKGRYTVRAEFTGFTPAAVDVEVMEVTGAIDLTLGIPTLSASLTVTAAVARRELDVPAGSTSRLGLTPRETPAMVDVVTFVEAQQRGLRNSVEALTASGAAARGATRPVSPSA